MDRLAAIQDINSFPFTKVMELADTTPVLFDCFIPDLDLVIWKMRPCKQTRTSDDFRLTALSAFSHATEVGLSEPGVIVSELDGFDFFVFPSHQREAVLLAMEVSTSDMPGEP